MTPEKRLWQTVLYKALIDATAQDPQGDENLREKRRATDWLTKGGKDFRTVCALAEVDPDFVRDAFLAGKINSELLRASEAESVRKGLGIQVHKGRQAIALRQQGLPWADVANAIGVIPSTARDYARRAARVGAG